LNMSGQRGFSICLRIAMLVVAFMCLCTSSFAAETPRRIVSLAPQITEIIYALGLEDNLVGVTTFCDYPPEAREKPKIGGMSNPSLEAVVSLRPDLVMMSTDGNPKEFQGRLENLNLRHYVFTARRIGELPGAIREIGKVLDVKDRAEELAAKVQGTLDKYAKAKRPEHPLKVLYIIWPEPLIVAGPGTAMDDTIKLMGHENVASGARLNYPKYSIEEVLRQAPDVIIIGGGLRGHGDMKKVSTAFLERIKNTPAMRSGRVYYPSDSLYRLGPRVVYGIEEMADILNR
jgi:iron complex transport system substrate-binding protein